MMPQALQPAPQMKILNKKTRLCRRGKEVAILVIFTGPLFLLLTDR